MRSFWQIFSLELTAFVRAKALAFLLLASVAWMFGLDFLVSSDGTSEGAHELYIHYSLGGVFLLLILVLLASATGSLARERDAKRLQLTLVRPVSRFALVAAKGLALTLIGAVVLGVSALILAARTDLSRPCNHVLSPVLPSPREEAKAMYESFMASPETPDIVKKTKKEIVLRLLENRAWDRYETIPTNGVARWTFDLSSFGEEPYFNLPPVIATRFRFSGAFNRRETAIGRLAIGTHVGSVSNLTQSVLMVPLAGIPSTIMQPPNELSFTNEGSTALQLRPRRDVQLLVPADGFGWNLLRTYLELVAVLALLIAFGLFLSASLGRPVAVFVAFVVLLMSEMSPSVIESYPDELEEKFADRIGLVLTRAAAEVTRPVSSLNPLEKLATDDAVELLELGRVLLVNCIAVPILFFALAGFILPRKQEGL